MKIETHGVIIEVKQGDIAAQDGFDTVVNAANRHLRPGGGVAGALHKAAGEELEKACRPHAPLKPGEALLTGAYGLPNRYVVHCLGPVYGQDTPEDRLLATCYRRALVLADDEGSRSIAFPALSTGAFGYPMEEAARVAFREIRRIVTELRHITHIAFVLFDEKAREIHERTLHEVFDITGDGREKEEESQ